MWRGEYFKTRCHTGPYKLRVVTISIEMVIILEFNLTFTSACPESLLIIRYRGIKEKKKDKIAAFYFNTVFLSRSICYNVISDCITNLHEYFTEQKGVSPIPLSDIMN